MFAESLKRLPFRRFSGIMALIPIIGYITISSIITIYGNNIKRLEYMPSPKAGLILHPVRIQIITAMSTQRMTARELSEVMPDIPQTTLYRHINALLVGGVIQVVEENPVRGTVERVYALVAPPSLSPKDLRGMNKQDYERVATMALSSFMSDIRRYLDHKPDGAYIDFLADGMDFNKVQLNLTDEEFHRMNQQIFTIMVAATENQPSPERKRRIFSYLFIPVDV